MLMFSSETIYYNAFYAVQDLTNVLSSSDIDDFCDILKKRLEGDPRIEKGAGVRFNFNDDESFFLNCKKNQFVELGDYIVYYGSDPISEEQLSTCNVFMAFNRPLLIAFELARKDYHDEVLRRKFDGTMTTLQDAMAGKPALVKKTKNCEYLSANIKEGSALLVVDVLEGSFLGKNLTEEEEIFCDNCAKIVKAFRDQELPVIFLCDSHRKDDDHELTVWGDHALAGTPESKPSFIFGGEDEWTLNDYYISKRRYSGFYGTDLDATLREHDCTDLYVIGFDLNICVLFTIADAFYRSYTTTLIEDAAYTSLIGTKGGGLEYIQKCFGTNVVSTDDILSESQC